MHVFAVAADLAEPLARLAAEGSESGGLTINWFWVLVSLMNFAVFFYIVWRVVLVPVGARLEERRERIEQGLRDADAARRDDAKRGQPVHLGRADGLIRADHEPDDVLALPGRVGAFDLGQVADDARDLLERVVGVGDEDPHASPSP